MKRKILALATALALALSLSVCVSAAGQQAGSWTKLSDGYTADTPGTQPTAVPLPDKDTYAITDWVDADHALCTKSLGDKETAFVVVGRDGSEVTLQFATPTAQIIAAQAGRIAYTNQANDTVYVGRFDGKAALTPVLEEKLGGTLRTRSVQAFNADASKLALVYLPNGTANARNAKLFDLTGGTAKTISAPQAKADILEVSWLSNGALKVVVEAQGDQPVYTRPGSTARPPSPPLGATWRWPSSSISSACSGVPGRTPTGPSTMTWTASPTGRRASPCWCGRWVPAIRRGRRRTTPIPMCPAGPTAS